MKYDYEKYKEYQKEYQLNSPKAKEARKRHYRKKYSENPEHYYEATKKYRLTYRGRLMMLLQSAKSRAKKTGLDFNLDIDFLMSQPNVCPILSLQFDITDTNRNTSPSLDRVDSTKGYTKVNTRLISRRANTIKNDGTIEEHERIIAYMKDSIYQRA